MIEEGFINLISNVGFPIAVCLILFFKLGKQLDNNTEALYQIKEVIHTCPYKRSERGA